MNFNKFFAVLAVAGCVAGNAQAALIGDWTFEGSGTPTDSTGNFSGFEMNGSASVTGGALNTSGTSSTSNGWARATGYSGATITSHTLVAWVKLNDFNAVGGAPIAIQQPSILDYDSIAFLGTHTWEQSSGWHNRDNFAYGYTETTPGQLLLLAFTYEENVGSGQVTVTEYRNGVSFGSYTAGHPMQFPATDTQILFGTRAYVGGPAGALDAAIYEARLYNTALTASEVSALTQSSAAVPEPGTLALASMAVLGLVSRRTRRTAAAK